jgi:hypothetical protein
MEMKQIQRWRDLWQVTAMYAAFANAAAKKRRHILAINGKIASKK